MNIVQSINDFNQFRIPLSNTESFFEFNRLHTKQTRLTTPSIVCYVQIEQDKTNRPFVKNVVKCYISLNPSEDIKNDSSIFNIFDEILIYQNMENENIDFNQTISDKQLRLFENQIEKIKKYFEVQL